MRRFSALTILFACAVPAVFPAAASEVDPAAAIAAPDLLAAVEALADPQLAGRMPGGEGYEQAVEGAVFLFSGLGLRPGGDDGFRQRFEMEYNDIPAPCRLALTGADGVERELELGSDYVWRGFTGGGEIDAPVVFAGYGLSAPERGYDDYADIDVAGKVVLAFKQAPRWKPDDGEGWDGRELPRPKAITAAIRGALGLLLVSRPADERPQPVIGSVLHGDGVQPMDVPQAQISLPAAAALFSGGMDELIGLQREIDAGRAPRPRDLPARARMEVRPRYQPRAEVCNVVGILPGSDPGLADECVVIGAHLDHVGRQGEVVFAGANDNASGSAAVMAAAAAMAGAPRRPARSVVFVLFAGEEQGLYGSRHYVENPAVPLERTVAMLNLDCVAHGDSIQLGGGKTQPRLWSLAREIDAGHAALTVDRTWAGGGADATPFHEAGVPTLYFATTNSYTHLHLPSDTPDTIDPQLLAEVARLACRTAWAVADGSYSGEEAGE